MPPSFEVISEENRESNSSISKLYVEISKLKGSKLK